MAEWAALAIAAVGAAASAYSAYETEQNVKKATHPAAPQMRPTADTAPLDEQRRKRLMNPDGRDQTILAPTATPGSLLGLPGAPPSAVPRTTLGG